MEDTANVARGVPSGLSRAVLPLLIGLLGLALTALMAVVQQGAAEREQQLMFEQAVERQQQTLVDSVSEHIDDLNEVVDFISAVYPSDLEEYRRFFTNSQLVGQLSNIDPGVLMIEAVDIEDVAELEARERALGHDGFAVRFLTPPVGDQLLVVTRTVRDASIGPFPIIGLDVSAIVTDILGQEVPLEGQSIEPMKTDSILNGFLIGTQIDEAAATPAVVSVTTAIPDPVSGETVAWVIRLFDPRTLVTDIDSPVDRRLNVEVLMNVLDESVVLGETDEPIAFDDAPLAQELYTTSSGFEWTTRIWAGSDFGVPTGLLDQGATWTFGLFVTAFVMLGATWRAVQEFQLSRANFELEHARTLASTDSLTGLLNRQGFVDRMRDLHPNVGGTVFFIDLDGFKQVNDTRGHEGGDDVLREAAMLLSSQFRARDLVGRFGGDEFAVFTPDLSGPDHHENVSARVINSLSVLEDDVSCSVGATTRSPADPVDVLELIRRADEAMYRAKQLGGGRFETSDIG